MTSGDWPSELDAVAAAPANHLLLDSRTADVPMDAPATIWAEPIEPHTLENVGDRRIHAIVVEIKS